MSINKIIISGRLGKAVDLRQTQSGKAVATFTLAVTDSFNREVTHWFDCVVWGATAESCAKYLDKGSRVIVDGRGGFRSWEKDGKKYTKFEVTADRVEFLDPPRSKQNDDAADFADIGQEIADDDDFPL